MRAAPAGLDYDAEVQAGDRGQGEASGELRYDKLGQVPSREDKMP